MVKKVKNHINDYPKFDKTKHVYIIATASGDGRLVHFGTGISDAIADDLAHVLDNVPMSDDEHTELARVDWKDWIDVLSVYDEKGLEIASFNLKSWEWETP